MFLFVLAPHSVVVEDVQRDVEIILYGRLSIVHNYSIFSPMVGKYPDDSIIWNSGLIRNTGTSGNFLLPSVVVYTYIYILYVYILSYYYITQLNKIVINDKKLQYGFVCSEEVGRNQRMIPCRYYSILKNYSVLPADVGDQLGYSNIWTFLTVPI